MKMIKISVVLFIIFILAGVAYSAEISTGVKAALNFPNLKGGHSELEDLSRTSKPGFSGGGYLRISSDDNILAIQPELLLTMTNIKITEEKGDKSNLHIFYLDVPLLLRGSFPLPVPNYFAPFIFTGPYISIKLKNIYRGDNHPSIKISNFNIGVLIGVGINLENISFEGAYVRDLTNYNDYLRYHSIKLMMSKKLGG
jgi:hypothetical protein